MYHFFTFKKPLGPHRGTLSQNGSTVTEATLPQLLSFLVPYLVTSRRFLVPYVVNFRDHFPIMRLQKTETGCLIIMRTYILCIPIKWH